MKKGIIVTTIGTVLGGAILALTTDIIGIIFQIISLISNGLIWMWIKLTSSYSMPGWIYLIVGCFTIYSLYRFLLSTKISTHEPEYYRYTEDSIHGAIWRWSWNNDKVSNLSCFCPVCDAQLVPIEAISETQLICERCTTNRSGNPYDPQWKVVATVNGGDRHYVSGAVEREILRRIRTKTHPI